MSWRRARGADLQALLALGCAAEWRAVPFTCRLLGWNGPALPARREAELYVHRPTADAAADAALLFSSAGLLLPLLSSFVVEGRRPPFPALPRLRRRLHSVMGPSSEVLWAEAGLRREPRCSVDYYLMVLERERFQAEPPPDHPAPSGLRIRPASVQDAALLYPLQRDYELEEVLLEPGRFHPRACLANLRLLLRRQIVVAAELEGSVVAKAGTNARGFRCDQIGGVFTVAEQRNRGIGTAVMRALLERIFRLKESACLFVKKSNLPALALYRGLGFRICEDYRISYYRD